MKLKFTDDGDGVCPVCGKIILYSDMSSAANCEHVLFIYIDASVKDEPGFDMYKDELKKYLGNISAALDHNDIEAATKLLPKDSIIAEYSDYECGSYVNMYFGICSKNINLQKDMPKRKYSKNKKQKQ